MGKRLSKIYTRTGDSGETGLGDGTRIRKAHPRVEAMGTVDELNSSIGLLIEELALDGESPDELQPIAALLRRSQHRIFDLGGELSIPLYKKDGKDGEAYAILTQKHVTELEIHLDALNQQLEPLANFILPGGSRLIAQCHLARAVCRRAERRVMALAETEPVNPNSLKYLNRMSDYLFVVARTCARVTKVAEILWQKD